MSSTPCSPSNNRTFSDKMSDYELSTLIGVGSFGRVYKAKYVDRGKCESGSVGQVRECAVKCISKKSSPNLGKIYAEVSIHMRAKHENILELYNVIEDEEHVYLILELCPGGSLMQFVKTQVSKGQTNGQHDDGKNDKRTLNSPILPYATIRKMMSQVCHGLDYLHRNGIVHRDLNLNNLLLLSTLDSPHDDFIIKIADFGLAIDINSPKQSANPSHKLHRDQQVMAMNMPVGTTICGTPGFISPEVWSQMQTVSPASDIFSLGSILFSLIAGYTPKGELDLTYYSPLAGDLISRLLAADPRQRPSISTTLTHPFMIGPFNTHRLAPISKTTRTINLSIDHEGVVKLIFFKNNSSIEISKSGDSISIVSNNGKVECFSLETLTPNHWKKYIYAWRFVELVKAKTPKVTVNCHQDSENQDIIKACLMENGDFEVTMIDTSNNSTHKILIDKRNENNLDRMDRQVKKRLFSLKEKCVAIEKQLSEASIDCFPATLGRKNKIISKDNNSITEQGLTTTSSHIMRYAYVKGLGTASQLSNGMIQVAFSDGSSMSLASNSQIIFSHNGSQQMFHKHDSLPEFVKEKLALLPQVVEELRQKSPSMQCSK